MTEKKKKQTKRKDYEYSDEELVTMARLHPDFKSPAYQFYVNDFLGSSRVVMMDLQAVGAYRMLLDTEWNEKDCGLPCEDDALAKLSRAYGYWEEIKSQVLPMFFLYGGRYYSRRLLIERKKQINMRKQRIKAAEKRWEDAK